MPLSRRELLAAFAAAPLARAAEWIPLFDGKSLSGWRVAGPASSFKVVDGAISADGPKAHLFYEGPVQNARFRDFELKLEFRSQPLANSGIYFHTAYQAEDWPKQGFEVQINNTALGEGSYRERKKTGSLYGIRNTYKAFARDGEWTPVHILVQGPRVQVRVNNLLLVDYVEPADGAPRKLGQGTFALQCHDPGSRVMFRNLVVRPLPAGELVPRPAWDAVDREIVRLAGENFPMVDYHLHLKGGWTIEEALANSRRLGIAYGIAANCGNGFPIQTDEAARAYVDSLRGQPVYVAMQCEGREWVKMFRPETVALFDYVFTDGMTWTDDDGRRMRLWIKEEVGEISDPERFMETLVNRIEGILEREPVDIYANPTFLPDVIAARYDALWTPRRMDRVISAAVNNGVAIEINNRYRLPSLAFIKRAKAAGAKFSFGTNNAGREDVGRCEYALEAVRECGLKWTDIFVPKPDGEKPVQKKGLPT